MQARAQDVFNRTPHEASFGVAGLSTLMTLSSYAHGCDDLTFYTAFALTVASSAHAVSQYGASNTYEAMKKSLASGGSTLRNFGASLGLFKTATPDAGTTSPAVSPELEERPSTPRP